MDLRVRHVPAPPGRRVVCAQSPLGMPPRFALLPGRDAGQPQPRGQHRPDVRQPSQRRPDGRVSQPGGGHPVPGQPAPGRPRPEPVGGDIPSLPPPGHHVGHPAGRHPQRLRQQIVRRAVVLTAQQEAVDVPLADPYRTSVSAPRNPGRSDVQGLSLSAHDSPQAVPPVPQLSPHVPGSTQAVTDCSANPAAL